MFDRSSGDSPRDQAQRPIRLALVVLGGLVAGLILAASIVGAHHFQDGTMGSGQDAHAYWLALRGAPYVATAGEYGAYLYSPSFLQALSPMLALAWPQFLALWTALLLGALLALCGPVLFAVALPLAFFEIWGGNIHLLLALAIVIGFRHPASWAFVLLTKVTPGIGLIWFAVRREWRHLGVAGGATALVIGLSLAFDPNVWRSWVDLLAGQASSSPPTGSIGIPIGIRLPIAAVVIAYAAAYNRRWLVPFGVFLAMPVMWWGGISILLASLALERDNLERRLLQAVADLRVATGRPSVAQPQWVPEPEG
ncbi:MAG: glycosyltransferase family 87 protein [Candidatus Limnocylindrales bacterium]